MPYFRHPPANISLTIIGESLPQGPLQEVAQES